MPSQDIPTVNNGNYSDEMYYSKNIKINTNPNVDTDKTNADPHDNMTNTITFNPNAHANNNVNTDLSINVNLNQNTNTNTSPKFNINPIKLVNTSPREAYNEQINTQIPRLSTTPERITLKETRPPKIVLLNQQTIPLGNPQPSPINLHNTRNNLYNAGNDTFNSMGYQNNAVGGLQRVDVISISNQNTQEVKKVVDMKFSDLPMGESLMFNNNS